MTTFSASEFTHGFTLTRIARTKIVGTIHQTSFARLLSALEAMFSGAYERLVVHAVNFTRHDSPRNKSHLVVFNTFCITHML